MLPVSPVGVQVDFDLGIQQVGQELAHRQCGCALRLGLRAGYRSFAVLSAANWEADLADKVEADSEGKLLCSLKDVCVVF